MYGDRRFISKDNRNGISTDSWTEVYFLSKPSWLSPSLALTLNAEIGNSSPAKSPGPRLTRRENIVHNGEYFSFRQDKLCIFKVHRHPKHIVRLVN